MTLDTDTLSALADAIALRLGQILPPGWPEGRGHLTEPELAEYLAMSQDYVRGLRREEKITYTRMGRAIRYSAADVSQYLDRCRQGGNGR